MAKQGYFVMDSMEKTLTYGVTVYQVWQEGGPILNIQALDIWWGDNEGWWNGGRHGCGNIRTVIEEVAIS